MSSILGFPRVGQNRELKKALESFWSGKSTQSDLESVAKALRKETPASMSSEHWNYRYAYTTMPVHEVLGIELRVSCVLSKHSA